jgi:phage portal protein BeeE
MVGQSPDRAGPITANSPEIARLFAAPPVSSGVGVSETTALNVASVWAAVRLISGQVASLPLVLYTRTPDGGKIRNPGDPRYRVLHEEMNRDMTAIVARETIPGSCS